MCHACGQQTVEAASTHRASLRYCTSLDGLPFHVCWVIVSVMEATVTQHKEVVCFCCGASLFSSCTVACCTFSLQWVQFFWWSTRTCSHTPVCRRALLQRDVCSLSSHQQEKWPRGSLLKGCKRQTQEPPSPASRHAYALHPAEFARACVQSVSPSTRHTTVGSSVAWASVLLHFLFQLAVTT